MSSFTTTDEAESVTAHEVINTNVNKQNGGVGPDTTMRLFNQI